MMTNMCFHAHGEHEGEIVWEFKYFKQNMAEKNETHIMSSTYLKYLADFEII